MKAQLTLITSLKPSVLTKKYSLDVRGVLQVETSANMVAGNAERLTLNSAQDFADLLEKMNPAQALAYGITEQPSTALFSRKEYEKLGKPANAITRTKDSFRWANGGGVLMLDYDPQEGAPALTRQQLIEALTGVMPELSTSAYIWWCSSSSLIYNGVEQVNGIKGQRLYLLVKDAKDIPRAGKNLFSRLWLAGHGHIMVTRAGTLLERTIIDASVWQTNRLDFAAGAQCTPPLEQRRGKPVVVDGELLDTVQALPNLTPEEEADLNAAIKIAKETIEPERQAVRKKYIEEEAANLIKRSGIEATEENLEQAQATISRAVNSGVLAGDFIVTLASGETVTIGEVLDNPSKYHNQLTLDPLEPEYNGQKVVGKFYLIGGRANLYSQAHGGKSYRLIRQPRRIEHVNGTTADTTQRTLEFLRQLPDVFDMGSSLVLVQDGKAHTQNIHSFSYWLGSVAQFWTWKERNGELSERSIDPPQQTINQLLAIGAGRNLKPLKAVLSAPVIDLNGRVIDRAGYDSKTQLYLDMNEDPLPVPDNPTPEQVRLALEFLMQPFNDFAVNTALDKGVLLAAILTAIQRPVLALAPAIGLDAPVQGTGKTYLAQCLGMLATGEDVPASPPVKGRDDEEVRKRLASMLMTDSRVILWDNILGDFDSASMASLITTETYTDRILGKTEQSTLINRALILLTGNNLTLAGDMPRRVLKCRLDAQIANPTLRVFKGDPKAFIKQNRVKLVQAGLTIIKAYLSSPECKAGGSVKGGANGFSEWDQLVRQPAAWIAQTIGAGEYEDPAEALKEAIANDPELEALALALEGIKNLMGEKWFETGDLYNQLERPSCTEAENQGKPQELREILEDLTGSNKLTTRGLGRVLGYRVDRIANGLKLEKRTGARVAKFRVVSVAEDQQVQQIA